MTMRTSAAKRIRGYRLSLLAALAPRLDQDRAIPLLLLHRRLLVSVGYPNTSVQYCRGRSGDLLPTVEASSLTHSSHSIRESVMDIVEKHLVPTVFASMCQRHDVVEKRVRSLRILGDPFLPNMRMIEVRDEHPSNRITTACKKSHCEEEG